MSPAARLAEALGSEAMTLPARRADVDAAPYSAVLGEGKRPVCHPNAPLELQVATVPHRGASQDARAVRRIPVCEPCTLPALEKCRPEAPARTRTRCEPNTLFYVRLARFACSGQSDAPMAGHDRGRVHARVALALITRNTTISCMHATYIAPVCPSS